MVTQARESITFPRFSAKKYLSDNRRPAAALVVLLLLWAFFIISNPTVGVNPVAYMAVFTSLPISMVLAVPLVFIVAVGEIDLSFPSIIGVSAWAFAACAQSDLGPWVGVVAAVIVGMLAGLLNGLLVTKAGLSSLVSTLGMSFLLRGLIYIGTNANGISLSFLRDTPVSSLFIGKIPVFGILFPIQMIWGLVFGLVGWWLFNRHRFGAHICCVGDNAESAREMGIDVDRTRILAFVYVGIASALAGIFSTLLNNTFWPVTGDGYLLSVLAAVFVGGTPTWGGVGTIVGALIGATSIGFITTELVAAGLTGLTTQFFYGLVLILSLVAHRFNQQRRY